LLKRYALTLAFAAATSTLFAQTPDTATLNGRVVDPTHAGIANAQITVTNQQTGLTRSVTTGSSGSFSLVGLPSAGIYRVVAHKVGFADTTLAATTLAGGSAAEISLQLAVAGTKAEVTVSGAANELRTDQPQLGTRLDAYQMEETPLPNQRITYLPLLNAANRPAINQGDIFMDQDLFTTNGAGRRQTWFEVDGVSGNDSWGRQTVFTNIPLSSVQEMAILTNAFSAEYGASTGSVINLVTRSGGDRYHGEVAGVWRPIAPEAALEGFNANNATSGNEVTNDRLGQESFAIGGPIKFSPSTRFFLAAEHSDERKGSPVTSPLDPVNYIGVYHDWLAFLRLDQQFNPHNNGFVRANLDAYFDTNPNGIVGGASLPTVARIFRRRTYTLEFGDTAVFTPHLVNSARAQFQLASPITEFDPVVYGTQFVVPITGLATFTTGTSQSALLLNRQYQFSDTLTATLGRHQVNLGADAILAHTGGNSKEFGGPVYLGKFTYNTCAQAGDTTAQLEAYCEGPAFLNNLANVANYSQSFGNAAYTVNDAIWSLFVQDDYRATNRLTLNAGLRYERQTFTDATLNFAPRAGLVYDVTDRGKTVVRAGFGIYYSQIVDNDEANYALTGPTGVFTYTATPGQVGFPTSIAAAPIPSFPAGGVVPLRSLYLRPGLSSYYNQFFPTSTLVGYPGKLLNPYSEQYTASIEQQLPANWILSIDYVGTHQLRNIRPLDVDAPSSFIRTAQGQTRTANAANCTRPYWISFYQSLGTTCTGTGTIPPYSVIQSDVNDGYLHYNALDVNLRHNFSHNFETLISYTWSHTLDNVDPDATSQNPNDPLQTGHAEYGNALYDQRNRLVLSGVYVAPFKIHVGGLASLAGGLPYNLTTGTTNSGDTGATTDRPVINGVVVGRNTGRGTPLYDVEPFISRAFPLFHESVKLDLRAEAFNVLNHANFVTFNGTYGNTTAAPATLGTPSYGVTAQLPARSLQFSAKVSF
jgi:outer membrane receptor protein involved in Fe transport